jgi:hypothetical protein
MACTEARTQQRRAEEVEDNENNNGTRLAWRELGRNVYCVQLVINGQRVMVVNRRLLGKDIVRRQPLFFFSDDRTNVRNGAT